MRQVGYLQEVNRDARSAKHLKKKLFVMYFYAEFYENLAHDLV